MDKNTQIGIGLISTALIGVGIYFGFVKKGEDGKTWISRMTSPDDEPTKEEDQIITSTSDPVNQTKPKPKQKPPTVKFNKGDVVMAGQDMAIFTQPAAEDRFMKAAAIRFDKLGTFVGISSSYPGWSKIYVTKTLKLKGKYVPNKWEGYAKTDMLTNPLK